MAFESMIASIDFSLLNTWSKSSLTSDKSSPGNCSISSCSFSFSEVSLAWYMCGRDTFASGVLANKTMNVDKARTIGENILTKMKGKNVEDYTFHRKDQAVTLASGSTIRVHGQEVQVDPQLLFQRLTVFADKHEDPKSLFDYELCSHPAPLFESSSLPRKANKPILADAIWELVQDKTGAYQEPADSEQLSESRTAFILDGGALLQRVPWQTGLAFHELCQLYVEYIKKRYQNVTIVFDGYESGPSIKDATHQRRTAGKVSPMVNFTSQMVNKVKKEEFLANKINKQRFINLLSTCLSNAGHRVVCAKDDADVPIVLTAIESAQSCDTVVVGDDTDLLILLCFHADLESHDLLFMPEEKKTTKKHRVWNIKKTKLGLGTDLCSKLLFVHAILGCDSTSQPFGIGKGKALKMIQQNPSFAKLAETLTQSDLSRQDIVNLGESALVAIYNGSEGEGLNSLRYRRFCEKVVRSSKRIEPHSLPPTAAAAKFHSLRIYYQIQEWKGCSHLDPKEYGWKMSDDLLLPVMTDKEPAPKNVLEIIHCNCKTGCNTRRCTCRLHGLDCNSACGQCKGISCMNTQKPDLDEHDSE